MAESPSHIQKGNHQDRANLAFELTSRGIFLQGARSRGRGLATAFLSTVVYKTEEGRKAALVSDESSPLQSAGSERLVRPSSPSKTLRGFPGTKSVCLRRADPHAADKG